MTRHEFLGYLHELLRPNLYLEIGVQYGSSLALAVHSTVAIGIDPQPLVSAVDNQDIYRMTSDEFFAANDTNRWSWSGTIDMAFIDGMHLYEYALRDFMNVERHSHQDSVVVFDDVLPRNQEEASRTQCPGDWTGDVWKVHRILRRMRPDLGIALVNTQPTGVMLVRGLDPRNDVLATMSKTIEALYPLEDEPVPDEYLDRTHAYTPEAALHMLVRESEGS